MDRLAAAAALASCALVALAASSGFRPPRSRAVYDTAPHVEEPITVHGTDTRVAVHGTERKCSLTSGFEVEGAREDTVAALEAAIGRRTIGGRTWIGRIGKRDVLTWLPEEIETGVPVEIVVYLEGYGSFADRAMDGRHAAAIEWLEERGNAVYVAPDAPSSAKWGSPRSKQRYFAKGGFGRLVERVEAEIREACPGTRTRLTLVGFSNGGKGVRDAVRELDDRGELGKLRQVVFADANYGEWLEETWEVVEELEPFVTVLVGTRANRERAREFMEIVGAGRASGTGAGPVRVVTLEGEDHHGIGDVAIQYLRP